MAVAVAVTAKWLPPPFSGLAAVTVAEPNVLPTADCVHAVAHPLPPTPGYWSVGDVPLPPVNRDTVASAGVTGATVDGADRVTALTADTR